ncbi:Uu.00g099470.m01.CDS01 [Anthostomella pinea]|uniref:Uu.00g099470.m01.CDS01 n=1 Tax=Anthostomella pinea TaxID=933095 RepID=A0AAI8V7Q9_9PEZI|nr:Uu.00g099470.m01.CDS01 [Anthostomella pinea]
MSVFLGLNAMLVTDWDDGCTVTIYPGDSFTCEGDPLFQKSKKEAKDDGLLSDDGSYMCRTGFPGGFGPYYASYICKK